MPKILGITFIIFISLIEFSFAEKKIAFIDIYKIINESEFGKKSYKKIENDFKKENEKLLKVEKKLISEEREILNQKNILSEDELNNKKRLINERINKIRIDKTNEMVQSLNTILSKYADENDISLVIQKKFIVIAKSGLDITNEVLKIFNKENK